MKLSHIAILIVTQQKSKRHLGFKQHVISLCEKKKMFSNEHTQYIYDHYLT